MQPLVANLRDQDMRDLAGDYASLERERIKAAAAAAANIETPRVVRNGDPMRAIGACSTCQSPHAGRRSNDIHRQMRNAAKRLDQREIAELSRYYASR